jgi:hypothetical protein
MERSDKAVLREIEDHVLQPQIVTAALRKAVVRLKRRAAANVNSTDRETLGRQLATVDRELANLTSAVTAGGEVQTLVEAIREREGHRAILRRRIAALDAAERVTEFDPSAVERALAAKLAEWRAFAASTRPTGAADPPEAAREESAAVQAVSERPKPLV